MASLNEISRPSYTSWTTCCAPSSSLLPGRAGHRGTERREAAKDLRSRAPALVSFFLATHAPPYSLPFREPRCKCPEGGRESAGVDSVEGGGAEEADCRAEGSPGAEEGGCRQSSLLQHRLEPDKGVWQARGRGGGWEERRCAGAVPATRLSPPLRARALHRLVRVPAAQSEHRLTAGTFFSLSWAIISC